MIIDSDEIRRHFEKALDRIIEDYWAENALELAACAGCSYSWRDTAAAQFIRDPNSVEEDCSVSSPSACPAIQAALTEILKNYGEKKA